jgi:hypothetical protein
VKKVVAVIALLCVSYAAFAANAPEVSSPKNGDRIGSNVFVTCKTDGKQFVIVITDVYVKGNLTGSVPGIRHWTEDDGTLTVRIATPRVFNAPKSDTSYKIRVFSQRPGGEKSPETVVRCYPE